jgi:hypothetical protein
MSKYGIINTMINPNNHPMSSEVVEHYLEEAGWGAAVARIPFSQILHGRGFTHRHQQMLRWSAELRGTNLLKLIGTTDGTVVRAVVDFLLELKGGRMEVVQLERFYPQTSHAGASWGGHPRTWNDQRPGIAPFPSPLDNLYASPYPDPAIGGPKYLNGNVIQLEFKFYSEIEPYIDMLYKRGSKQKDLLNRISQIVRDQDNQDITPRQFYFRMTGQWQEGVPLNVTINLHGVDLETQKPILDYTISLF